MPPPRTPGGIEDAIRDIRTAIQIITIRLNDLEARYRETSPEPLRGSGCMEKPESVNFGVKPDTKPDTQQGVSP